MKQFLLAFIILPLFFSAQAPYNKMIGVNTSEWYIFNAFIPISYSSGNKAVSTTTASFAPYFGKYSATKDTLVLGKTYKKFYHAYTYPTSPSNTHLGYIREDSATRRVYFLDKTSSSEDLIYDFSLAVGDSIYLDFPMTFGNFPKAYYKVKSIATVTTNVGPRNQLRLVKSTGTTYDTLKWIESVGSIIHPVYMYSSSYGMGQFSGGSGGCKYPYDLGLACKYSDNLKFYQSCTYTLAQLNACIFKYDSCNYWNTCSGIKETSLIRSFAFYPNPSRTESTVNVWLNESSPVSMEILDMTGRSVYNAFSGQLPEGESNVKIRLEDIEQGSYFLEVKAGSSRFRTPFIVIH